jgi:hypothetical protein
MNRGGPGAFWDDAEMSDETGWASPTPPPSTQAPPPWTPPPVWGYAPTAPKPGVIPLRPLTLSDVLDGAFAVLRGQPRTVYTLSAIVAGINLGFGVLLQVVRPNTVIAASAGTISVSNLSAYFGIAGLSFLVATVVSSWLLAALTVVVTEAVLGRRTSPGEAIRRVRPQLAVVALLGLAVRISTDVSAIVIVGIFLSGAWALAVPALVMERSGFTTGLRRSWRLAVPDWWRVWGIRTLAVVIAGLAASVLVFPVELALLGGLALRPASSFSLAAEVGVLIVTSVASLLTLPFPLIVQVVLYVDRRMRAEGLDIQLARAAGQPPGP